MASLSVQEAAGALGVSPDTVRRRIRNGALAARQRPTPQGYQWQVDVPDEALAQAGASDPRLAELHHLEETVQDLRRALDIASEELRARRKEVEHLLGLVEALQTRNEAGTELASPTARASGPV